MKAKPNGNFVVFSVESSRKVICVLQKLRTGLSHSQAPKESAQKICAKLGISIKCFRNTGGFLRIRGCLGDEGGQSKAAARFYFRISQGQIFTRVLCVRPKSISQLHSHLWKYVHWPPESPISCKKVPFKQKTLAIFSRKGT